MLYFPYGRTQITHNYRWTGTEWELRRTGTYLVDPKIYQQTQVFLSSWLNKNVKGGISNDLNADSATESQTRP
jgi:hypothetical protein